MDHRLAIYPLRAYSIVENGVSVARHQAKRKPIDQSWLH
jgi:hypothetical protein